MEGRSRTTPALSLKLIGVKLEDQISRYLCSHPNSNLVSASILGKEENIYELKPTVLEINHPEAELQGMAPLHLACLFGYLEVANVLIESGADVELRVEKTIAKETPLHIAAWNGYSGF